MSSHGPNLSNLPIDKPTNLDVAADAQGITFLRSTTITRVEREADGDSSTTVRHVARFAIRPGALPDMIHRYGSQTFRPAFATVEWNNGKLERVGVTGPRVLKSGRLSTAGSAESRNYDWSAYRINKGEDPLPEALSVVITDYEQRVAQATTEPGGAK